MIFLALATMLAQAAPVRAAWHGGSANTTLTEMDPYQGAFFGVCATKRVFSNYSGPLFRVQRQLDQATMDVFPAADGWPDMGAIERWSQLSALFVPICYDQTGNNRSMSQATVSVMPLLNRYGSRPAIHFDGFSMAYSAPGLLPISNAVSGLTAVAVRAKDTSDTTVGFGLFSIANDTAFNSINMAVGLIDPPLASERCYGGRVSTDGFNKSVGLTEDTLWRVQTCRHDYANQVLKHQVSNATTETKTLFGTAGITDAADSAGVFIGSFRGAFPWSGDLTLLGFAQGAASDAATTAWTDALVDLIPRYAAPTGPFRWGSFPKRDTGITTVVPGLLGNTAALIVPNGQTPVVTDLNTYQYKHATMIAYHHGRRWVAYFTNRNGETDGGLSVAVTSSTDAWATHMPLAFAVPPQSDWLPDGILIAPDATSRGVVNRAFQLYQDRLFLLSAIDQTNPPKELATVATEMFDDGSVGTPFLTSTMAYVANSGFPTYVYDPVLGPPLRHLANVWGQYGNGATDNSDPDPGWWTRNGMGFCERGPVALSDTGLDIAYIYRVCQGNPFAYSWIGVTHDGDVTESNLVQTNIPAGGSPVASVRLPDGRIASAGNPWPNRTMQYLAIYNADGSMQSVRATILPGGANAPAPYTGVGVGTTQIYGGVGKGGGCSYPGLWVDTDESLLLISCSIAKESIVVMSVPLGVL